VTLAIFLSYELFAIDDADELVVISLDCHGRGPARGRVAASLLALAARLRLGAYRFVASVG
jgi:hypothetical protein